MYQRPNRPAFVNPFQQQPIQYGSISAGAPQAGPLQPTAAQELTNMVKQRAMTGAVDKGAELAETGYRSFMNSALMNPAAAEAASTYGLGAKAALGSGSQAAMLAAQDAALGGSIAAAAPTATTAATTGAAGAGMGAGMAALGTAMPYIGAGLLAGKALGFFSKGGLVGPLSKASYASNGEKITADFYNKG